MGMIKVTPDVAPRNQQFSTCCWFASLEMLFDWKWRKERKDDKAEPWKILEKMDKSKDLYPYYMHDNGISPRECKETAKMLGLRWSGDGDFTANILYDMLTTHGPLWVAGMWRRGSSHVIVVTGVDKESGNIRYIDPWENYSLSDSPGTVSWLNSRGDVWKNCDASVMYWF
jgi:hypothetical protein